MNIYYSSDRQKGATLIVGLVLLLLVTMLAVAGIKMASTNIQVAGNEQFRNETESAANFVLDKVANDPNFTVTYLSGTQTVSADVGQATYTVTVSKPTCIRYRPIPVSELVTRVSGKDTILTEDLPCVQGMSSSPLTLSGGSTGSGSGLSLCSSTLWEVEADVTMDAATGADAKLVQGIETRLLAADALNACK